MEALDNAPHQPGRTVPFPGPGQSQDESQELERIQARAASLNRLLDTLLLDADSARTDSTR